MKAGVLLFMGVFRGITAAQSPARHEPGVMERERLQQAAAEDRYLPQ